MAVEWTEKLSVGYDLIDEQHRELIRRFDDLLEACQESRGREKVAELLGFLDDYVLIHFDAEEELMDFHAYPRSDEHREQHRYFIRKLTALQDSFRHQGASSVLVIQTNQALLAWFLNHIKQLDVQLGAFLRTRLGRP